MSSSSTAGSLPVATGTVSSGCKKSVFKNIHRPKAASIAYTTTEPYGGVIFATLVEYKIPAKMGPNPLPTDPPNMQRPFIVPRCCTGTVRLRAMVRVEKKVEEKARTMAYVMDKNSRVDQVNFPSGASRLVINDRGINATIGILNNVPIFIELYKPKRPTNFVTRKY